ncbi:hypothetical protein HAX54_009521 [Datura stramonium]|uniref:Uncharacterized protein n=1 Tax=Datura stramonium TaxID=4076 RepID=A0ABS8RWJ3_DATST|nr:hypothetical protein [Datura stramonium]
MWCFEFVVMRQSAHSAQTRPRYLLLFSVIQKVCYILGHANIFCTSAYSYSMTKVWDPGQCWIVNSYTSEIIEDQIIGVDINDISSSFARLTPSADMFVEIVLFTLITMCQRTAGCHTVLDKLPRRCVVCWIGWIEAYKRADNCEEAFSLFYLIQHEYVIFGRLLIVICNANPFIGMDSICEGSVMFNTCHFLLMVSFNNKVSSSTFIPYAIVILEKDNVVTWMMGSYKGAAYSSINLQLSEFVKIFLTGSKLILRHTLM